MINLIAGLIGIGFIGVITAIGDKHKWRIPSLLSQLLILIMVIIIVMR